MNERLQEILNSVTNSSFDISNLTESLNQAQNRSVPIGVKILTFIGAFFASFLFLLFLFGVQLINNVSAILIGALLVIFSGIYAHRRFKDPILEPFIISTSFLGQILLAIGLSNAESIKILCSIGIFMELILYLFFKNQIQKVVSVILIFLCGIALVWNTQYMALIQLLLGTVCFLIFILFYFEHEIARLRHDEFSFFLPTLLGLVFALLAIIIICMNHKSFGIPIKHWWISSLLIFFCLDFVMWDSFKTITKWPLRTGLITLTGLILFPTFNTPGVIAGIFLLFAGFRFRHTILGVLGVAFFLIFIVAYYYSMQVTLLTKSYIMLSTGILLFFVYWLAFSDRKSK